MDISMDISMDLSMDISMDLSMDIHIHGSSAINPTRPPIIGIYKGRVLLSAA